MATNRLYIVNTETEEYLCIAKCMDYGWNLGNVKLLDEFLSKTSGLQSKTPLKFFTESDIKKRNKYFFKCRNFNNSNEWKYFYK